MTCVSICRGRKQAFQESKMNLIRKWHVSALLRGQRAQLSKGIPLVFHPEAWYFPCRPQPWERETELNSSLGLGNASSLVCKRLLKSLKRLLQSKWRNMSYSTRNYFQSCRRTLQEPNFSWNNLFKRINLAVVRNGKVLRVLHDWIFEI